MVLLTLSIIGITYLITDHYVSGMIQNRLHQYLFVGNTVTSEIQRWQGENRWPFASLRSLTQMEDFKFWQIIHEEGVIFLANDDTTLGTKPDPILQPFISSNADALNTGSIHDIDALDLILYQQTFSVGHVRWQFVLGFSTQSISDSRNEIIASASLITLMVLAVSGAILFWAMRLFLQPITAIADGVKRIGEGDMSVRLTRTSNDELGQLADSVNQMVVQLEQREKDKLIAEDELKKSARRLRQLFERSANAIFVVDVKTGKYLDANSAATTLTGYSREELLRMHTTDLTPKNANQRLTTVQIRQESQIMGEVEYICANGDIKIGRLSTVPIEGNTVYGIVHDITDRYHFEQEILSKNNELKETASALHKSNSELEKALQEARCSKELKIANDALKLQEQQLQSQKLTLETINSELIKSHENTQFLNRELSKRNHQLESQTQEMEKAMQHLKEAQAQIIQNEKLASIGLLTAGVAHELNNPLNFIQGGATALEEYSKENLSEHAAFLDVIIESINTGVKRASSIVGSLSQFSRKSDNFNQSCDLHAIIDNCLIMLQNRIKNQIEIHKRYTEAPFQLVGNEGKLHQVFINVLFNAIQAITEQGVIEISTQLAGKSLLIIITDNGCGIKKEHLEKITEPFFTTKQSGQGTGLGLSIVTSILKEHKGSIQFDSEVGRGTEVTIKLPVYHTNRKNLTLQKSQNS